jgi:hypothetical protein
MTSVPQEPKQSKMNLPSNVSILLLVQKLFILIYSLQSQEFEVGMELSMLRFGCWHKILIPLVQKTFIFQLLGTGLCSATERMISVLLLTRG